MRLRTTAEPTERPSAYATATPPSGASGARTTRIGPDRPRSRLADRAAKSRWCRIACGALDTRRRRGAGSGRQAGAALGATIRDDGTATTGPHAAPEAVLAGSALALRLVGALHEMLGFVLEVRSSVVRRFPETPGLPENRQPENRQPMVGEQGSGRVGPIDHATDPSEPTPSRPAGPASSRPHETGRSWSPAKRHRHDRWSFGHVDLRFSAPLHRPVRRLLRCAATTHQPIDFPVFPRLDAFESGPSPGIRRRFVVLSTGVDVVVDSRERTLEADRP